MAVDASTLRIQHYPAPILRRKAAPIASITDEVRRVTDRMIQLMFEAEGIGLAAPQVGLPWRLFVAHVPEAEDRTAEGAIPSATIEPMVFINPRISQPSRDLVAMEEGCLSLPEIRGEVRRPSEILIEALGRDAKSFQLRASGLLARCLQHEFDHLEGVLIIDRMTHGSRMKNKSAVRDLEAGARHL